MSEVHRWGKTPPDTFQSEQKICLCLRGAAALSFITGAVSSAAKINDAESDYVEVIQLSSGDVIKCLSGN